MELATMGEEEAEETHFGHGHADGVDRARCEVGQGRSEAAEPQRDEGPSMAVLYAQSDHEEDQSQAEWGQTLGTSEHEAETGHGGTDPGHRHEAAEEGNQT